MVWTFKFVTVLCVLVAYIVGGESANILCLFTSDTRSHLIIHMSYVRALVDRGHNVTVVTTIPLNDKNPTYNHLYIPPSDVKIQEMSELKSQMTKQRGLRSLQAIVKVMISLGAMQYDAVKDKCFQDFMHNPDNKFDLIIMGYFFNDFQFGLALHFKCPIIISWVSSWSAFVDRFVGNPPEMAYVPISPMFGIPDPLTFKGRLLNFFNVGLLKIFTTALDRQMKGFYNDLFSATDYPSIDEASKKISLILCNSHFSEAFVRPNVPAFIEVGGIQIKDKPEPLPRGLQEIFNGSSEHGVIYLSFGSHMKTNNLNAETYQIIFRALAGLKQTVLWKWDSNEEIGNAPNIHYRKWLPQDDILAQPNLRLFITHAGKGGIAESQYHGVPMVAIPLFGDQPGNAEQVTQAGFGLQIDHTTMTTETFTATILEVLENPKYTEAVKQFSTLYRDRPMTARETAVYWIEYVIRHKGAYHMQSPLVHLNNLQYISADVVAFLLLVVYVAFKLCKTTVKFVLRMTKSKEQKVKKQ